MSQIERVISSMCTSYRVLRLAGHNINVTLLDFPLSALAPASPPGFIIRTRLIYNHHCKLASVKFHAFPTKVGNRRRIAKGKCFQKSRRRALQRHQHYLRREAWHNRIRVCHTVIHSYRRPGQVQYLIRSLRYTPLLDTRLVKLGE